MLLRKTNISHSTFLSESLFQTTASSRVTRIARVPPLTSYPLRALAQEQQTAQKEQNLVLHLRQNRSKRASSLPFPYPGLPRRVRYPNYKYRPAAIILSKCACLWHPTAYCNIFIFPYNVGFLCTRPLTDLIHVLPYYRHYCQTTRAFGIVLARKVEEDNS